MGLYRIRLKSGYRPRIVGAMKSVGMVVSRREESVDGVRYFYIDSKNKTEHSFWIANEGDEEFWYCGHSSSAPKIVGAFEAAGIFETK